MGVVSDMKKVKKMFPETRRAVMYSPVRLQEASLDELKKDMKKIYFKNAFTMLELVFVIVVLGIIAAIAMPRIDRDRTQEAADSILADIRYAQHMAMADYRQQSIGTNANQWQRSFCRQASSLHGDYLTHKKENSLRFYTSFQNTYSEGYL